MEPLVILAQVFHRRLDRLAADQRGVSAIEFALLLPLMIALYLGTVEISQGISVDRKVTMTARAVADLVSQASTINNSDMTDILSASTAVMTPYTASPLKVTVSSVVIDDKGKATIDWSDTLYGTARAKGSPVTLPNNLAIPSTSLIWSEVQYGYTPAIGYAITGTLTLKEQLYMSPRSSGAVTRSAN
jgi:Flp pilus assembly protein TadG